MKKTSHKAKRPPKRKNMWKRWSRDADANITADDKEAMRDFVERLRPILVRMGKGDLAKRMSECLDAHLEMRDRLDELRARGKVPKTLKEKLWSEAATKRCGSLLCPCCPGVVRGVRRRGALAHVRTFIADAITSHLVFTMERDPHDEVGALASIAQRAMRRLARRASGRVDFVGAYYAIHVSWRNGPPDESVHDRSGWHVHVHALVRGEYGAERPDQIEFANLWDDAVINAGGLGGGVKVVNKRGEIERRLGYFFKGEGKYVAALCDDDIEELVRFLFGAGRLRSPKLAGPLGGLHGNRRRRRIGFDPIARASKRRSEPLS